MTAPLHTLTNDTGAIAASRDAPRPDTGPSTAPRTSAPRATGIVLAPMEGALDAYMRDELTGEGGFLRCVTEFVRVTDALLPPSVFHRLCPELADGGTTPAGTPVFLQLLGSDPITLARNARRAAELGAPGIDLNFGCPARTVNRSRGGSVLLDEAPLVAEIVARVREAVPSAIPVTVKVRLGHDAPDALEAIAPAVRASGAAELCVHARCRRDGYRPPARWPLVAPMADAWTRINGEIWTVDDARAAQAASGCEALMLGRGALASPDLAARLSGDGHEPVRAWAEQCERVEARFLRSDARSPRHVGNRTKQWLMYLRRRYTEADALFERLRRLHDVASIRAAFAGHRAAGHDVTEGVAVPQTSSPLAAPPVRSVPTMQP